MSISNGSSEAELENDVCGSGSKLSDDSGIEDTWNEDNLAMEDNKSPGKTTDQGNNLTVDSSSFKNFTPLTPPEEEYQSYGPRNIYPLAPCQSPEPVIRTDIKAPNAKAGVCGIENLGNTCFMNAGLQCLFASPLLNQLIPDDNFSRLIANSDNSKAMLTMVETFQEIFRKVLSGEFKSVYPTEFHNALIHVHAIFRDRKQHDCQEFLSFFLNGLHDALNRVNPRRRMQARLDSRESSPPLSNLRLETSSESENDDCENTRGDSISKKMRMDIHDAEPDVGVECDEKVSEALNAWRSYLEQNHSIIVDIFQGQFKSMVTCEKCFHVSSTYEPFMHVSVPIPYSNEKQVVVIWHGLSRMNKPRQTKRYLVTVPKNACVGDVKNELAKTIQKEEDLDADRIIMAEVSKSTITRTLVDHMQLKFLNSKAEKKLYAIETRFHSNSTKTVSKNLGNDQQSVKSCCDSKTESRAEVQSKQTGDQFEQTSGQSMQFDDSLSKAMINKSATGWHTCGICLEDIFDDDLMIHEVCGGVLCSDCLQATSSYHSGQSFPCPVCNATVDEKTYEPISQCDQEQMEDRTILVPVFMRCKRREEGEGAEGTSARREQNETFGHPSILLLPSKMNTSYIHEGIDGLLSSRRDLQYTIHFTDSQAVACSRCDTFSDCSGCCVEKEGDVQLRPGDHLTIHFDDISRECVESFSSLTNDESLSLLRDGDVVQLSECFKFFSECEILSEENPWFCPKCRRNQVATKGISISRWPDVLIVHLKRFHFEGVRCVKINSPVEFQLNNFNLDFVCSAEIACKENCTYNLIGSVCHTGSLTCGHYTSFSKNFLDSNWYHFNDEVTSQVSPSEKDFEKVYMLFYQKSAAVNTPSSGE